MLSAVDEELEVCIGGELSSVITRSIGAEDPVHVYSGS